MLENNIILYFCIFLCLQNTWSTNVTFFTYDHSYDDSDITIIYRIKNITKFDTSYNAGFKDLNFLMTNKENYTIEIHSNSNSIVPIKILDKQIQNVKELFKGRLFQNIMNVSYNSSNWISGRSINKNGKYCNIDENYEYNRYTSTSYSYNTTTETGNNVEKCYYVFEFLNKKIPAIKDYTHTRDYYTNYYQYDLLSYDWIPTEDNSCISITYILKESDYGLFKVTIRITDNYNNLITSNELQIRNNIRTVKLTDMALKKDQKYKLEFILKLDDRFKQNINYYDYNKNMFGLFQIVAYYSEYDEKTTQIVSFQNINNIGGFGEGRIFNGISESTESICLNGGYESEKDQHCICPPGFKGQFCETGCGPNVYGADCNEICSIYNDNMCRGIMMCTEYGCECLPGLSGPLCNQDCAPGTYGAGCKQNCSSHCNNQCDQYTGICTNECEQGYVLPFCQHRYSYVMSSPELISSQYESLELKLNFNPENIKGTSKMIKYYQLLYKTLDEEQYRTSELTVLLNDTITTAIISNLEPDTTYKVGVLIVTDDGNFNDKDIVYGQYNTSCIQPEISEYNMKLVSGVKSINITWNKVQTQRLECDVTEYVLTLTSIKGEQLEILSSSDKGHFINNLLPSIEYKIQLTPKTNKGPLISSPFYSFSPLMTENDVKISNVSTEISNGKIKVFWKFTNKLKNDEEIFNVPMKCIIQYKVSRVFSCSLKDIENDWTTLSIFNRTSYEIFNAVPNAQYIIKLSVLVNDVDTIQSENKVYALTQSSSPTTEPILDTEHPMYITNNSVFVQWKIDPMTCSKLNGIFSKFYIELLDKSDNILQVKETNQNFITFNDLKSNSAYEMKIFIKTQFGYNPEKFLIVNFKTKYENLKPIDDIMVYKKSLKERMVGLRWSYLESSNVDGFIVSFNNDASSNTSNTFVIQPEKCSAWPEYYCHTFYNLTHSKTHTFKIKPKSVDYPEGGKVSSITFNIIDGLPDSPINIKSTEIGNTTIQLQWDIPWIFNSALKKFIIYVEEISSLDISTCCASIRQIETPIDEELPTYNYTLSDLQPGSTYMIGVVTVSKSSWYSSPAKILITKLVNV